MHVGLTLEALWHRVPGGTGRAALELAQALDARDDIVIDGIAAWHFGEPATALGDVRVYRHRLPRPLLYESWSRWAHPKVRRRGRVDVVHSTTIVPPPTGGVPLVVSVHDLAFRRFPDRFAKRVVRLLERSWRRVLGRADAVLSPSLATSADLRAAGLDADRLFLVPLGHTPRAVAKAQRAEVLRRHRIEGPFVLSVGTVEPRKNLPALLAAFAELAPERRDLLLVLAGPAGWGRSVVKMRQSLSPAIGERVVTTGFVSDDELAALYGEASAFCYPSLLEGFGLPVLEAMSYGAPVVTSSGTATQEVAGDAAVMVDPNVPSQIAVALARVLDDASLASELSAAGRARAATFTWEATAAATVDVYRKLTGGAS